MSATGKESIAICDRCRTKFPYQRLVADGNSPGLRVCPSCRDVKDPWRLPARKTEQVALSHPRPENPLTDDTNYLLNEQGFILNYGGERMVNA
jgi:hypothetical protein